MVEESKYLSAGAEKSIGSMNRREFLGRAAGAIGFPYVVWSSALGKDGAVAASERIVMAGIGVGSQGYGNMVGIDYSGKPSGGFLGQRDVQVVASCDVDANNRQRLIDVVNERYGNKDCAGYGDFRELLVRDDIDAVMVACPDHWHGLISVAAVRAGKDVYCEKPLAYSIAEGRAVVDAVRRYKAVFQVGSQQRSWQHFRFACELVRNGRIGKVGTVRVWLPKGGGWTGPLVREPVPAELDYEMWLGPAPWRPYCKWTVHGNFRWKSDYAGGPVTDWSGHHCDIAQWGMGTELTGPVEIEGEGDFLKGGFWDTVTSYRFVCRYEEGFTMIVEDSGRSPDGRDGIKFSKGTGGVLFEGERGWIHVNRGGLSANPASLRKERIGPEEVHLYESDNHKRNFVDCVRNRREVIAPAGVGHRSMSIGQLGLIAAKVRHKLRWDPENEQFIGDDKANRYLSRPMRSPWHL
ncbi:MAG: Gfo/Idh/MocA family protein [Planctomycetota bacterium]|jgi:predicted dehydrogenase